MSIELVSIEKTRWLKLFINDDQPFNMDDLLAVLAPLEIEKVVRTYESIAPAEIDDDIHTAHGVFTISQKFDEWAGTDIYSSSRGKKLMKKIRTLMLESGKYHLRGPR